VPGSDLLVFDPTVGTDSLPVAIAGHGSTIGVERGDRSIGVERGDKFYSQGSDIERAPSDARSVPNVWLHRPHII